MTCPAQFPTHSKSSEDGGVIPEPSLFVSHTNTFKHLFHTTPISCILDLYLASWLWHISTLMICKWLSLLFKTELLAFLPIFALPVFSVSVKESSSIQRWFFGLSLFVTAYLMTVISDLFLQFALFSLYCFILSFHLLSLKLLPGCSSFCSIF